MPRFMYREGVVTMSRVSWIGVAYREVIWITDLKEYLTSTEIAYLKLNGEIRKCTACV